MALRAGAQKGTASSRPKAIGRVRRAQMVTTYGVGAMVAVGEQSYVITGTDRWRVGDGQPDLREFRLESRLRVDGFRRPPFAQDDDTLGVPVRLFPEWYSCTGCHQNLKPYRRFDPKPRTNLCGTCEQSLTPSRFVVACDNGHLDDFPYWKWVHKGTEAQGGADRHDLRYRSSGRSASLRSIVIECSCGKKASMEGAFGEKALVRLGIQCAGGRPWHGSGNSESGCPANPRTLQRGSSSAWFSVQQSALSIPPFSQQVHKQIAPYLVLWIGQPDDFIVGQAEKLGLIDDSVTAGSVVAAVRDHETYLAGEQPDPTVLTGFAASDVLRQEEYRQLSHPANTPDFVCVVPTGSEAAEPPRGLQRTMAITRLREVRALQAFTRVHPPMEGDPAERFAKVSSAEMRWLPAIEVLGEGVFLRLDPTLLEAWEAQKGPDSPAERAARISTRHQQVLDDRAKPDRPAPRSKITARYVLVHTLAHALINEWALDAGYPAASMKERLYVSDDMAGVLIYTATSDSAGSLGGLVGMASPRRLRESVESAMHRISWCSADPLCMESDAAGADGLNLAACHACVLLPETSCEANNGFLDRSMLLAFSAM